MKKIKLSDHFGYGTILRYSLPSIGNTLAITSFQLVDGFFVSNLLGVKSFAAVNIISPVFFVLYGLGFMFGSGTSAAVAQLMGEGEQARANQVFTMSLAVMGLVGVVVGALNTLIMPTLSAWAGATPDNLPECVLYGRLLTSFLPLFLVNGAFLTLWITAEKAWLGMVVSAVNGTLNALLDWLFMGPLKLGIAGAALSTSLAAAVSAGFTIVYFSRKNGASLRFVRFEPEQLRELAQICSNGFSEMVDSISGNFTELVMNNQLMRLIGEVGVAAMGVYSYVGELFLAVFFGISSTSITVIGYKYGEKNKEELKGLVRRTTILTLVLGVVMCLLFVLMARPIAEIYLGYDRAACELAVKVLRISAMGCLLFGFVIFTSSLFTGLGDGRTSAIIAGSNSFALPVLMIFLLPALFGANAIWYANPLATFTAAMLCVFFLRTRYPRLMKAID